MNPRDPAGSEPATPEDRLRHRLAQLSTPDAADMLRHLGLRQVVMRGPRALVPLAGTIAGRARTLRLLPDREDIKAPPNGPVNRRLYDAILPGEVLVLDAMGRTDKAALGDMMFSRLHNRRVAAVLVDGMVRDVPVVAPKGLPIFACGSCPDSFMGAIRPWSADCDIQCGGVLVRPGDWIVADSEGVVVVPAALAEEVARLAEEKRADDRFSQALLEAGFPLDDTYPLPAHMRPFLAEFHRSGALPSAQAIAETRGRAAAAAA